MHQQNDAFEKQQQIHIQVLRDGLMQQQIRIQNIVMGCCLKSKNNAMGSLQRMKILKIWLEDRSD